MANARESPCERLDGQQARLEDRADGSTWQCPRRAVDVKRGVGHYDRARFTRHLGPNGGEPVVVGFDVAILGEDGRLAGVHGLLDKVPTQ